MKYIYAVLTGIYAGVGASLMFVGNPYFFLIGIYIGAAVILLLATIDFIISENRTPHSSNVGRAKKRPYISPLH